MRKTIYRNMLCKIAPGRIWQNLAELGRTWQNQAEPGRIGQNLAELGRIWQNLAELGRIRQNLAELGRFRPLRVTARHAGAGQRQPISFTRRKGHNVSP